MKKIIISSLLSVLFACNKGVDTVEAPQDTEIDPISWSECGYDPGDHPCDFTLKDQNNNDWNLYENYGNVFLIDLSTQWCSYCQVAASDVETVQNAYAGENFTYVTILIEDYAGNPASLELAQAWADHFEITSAPILVGSRDLIGTEENQGWDVSGWPTFILVDHNMVIRQYIRGYSSAAILTSIDILILESKSQ